MHSRGAIVLGNNMGPHTIDVAASEVSTMSDTRLVLDSIRRIVQALRVASRAAERQLGLTAAQLFVLQKLAAEGQATSLNELAERTLTHQSSVSVVVQRLVARGLVTRTNSATDARRIVLSLTPSGRALVRRAPQAAQERLIEAIERLPQANRRELASLLHTVAAHATDVETPAPLFFEESASKGKRRHNGSR